MDSTISSILREFLRFLTGSPTCPGVPRTVLVFKTLSPTSRKPPQSWANQDVWSPYYLMSLHVESRGYNIPNSTHFAKGLNELKPLLPPQVFVFVFINLSIYLLTYLLTYLFIFGCNGSFSSCGQWGLLFVAVRGLLIAVASLVAEHRL